MTLNSPIAGITYWERTDNAWISDATNAMSIDLDPKVIPHFATTSDRDLAYSDAIAGTGNYTAPQIGMVCAVGNPCIWYGWNGAAWVPDLARRVAYGQSKTFSAVAAGVNVYLLNMPDSNDFLGNSTGVTVPEDGVYVATLTVSTNTPVNPNRWYVELGAAGTVARNTMHATLSNEDRISVSLAGAQMGAGNSLICQFGHNYSGALDVSAYLTVAKVAS